MRAKEESLRILESALSIVSSGVEDAQVSLAGGQLGSTSFAENEMGPGEDRSVEQISIRLCDSGRSVCVQTADLSVDGIKAAGERGRKLLEHMPTSKSAVTLPEPQEYEGVEAYDAETARMQAIDRMPIVSKAILGAYRSGLSASGVLRVSRGALDAKSELGVYALANTRGLLAYHPATHAELRITMSSKSASRASVVAESYAAGHLPVKDLVASVLERASMGVPKTIRAGQYPAVLEPAAVAAVIRMMAQSCGAPLAKNGASFLSGQSEGERLFGSSVNLYDDYAHTLHRGVPFDDDGVARKRVSIIENGTVKATVCGWGSAVRYNMVATGHRVPQPSIGGRDAASHLVLAGGQSTLGDLIGGTQSGVLVSALSGVRFVDRKRLRLTGVADSGLFLIQQGELATPLGPMRVDIDLFSLFNEVEGLGAQSLALRTVVPAIKTARLSLTPAL